MPTSTPPAIKRNKLVLIIAYNLLRRFSIITLKGILQTAVKAESAIAQHPVVFDVIVFINYHHIFGDLAL